MSRIMTEQDLVDYTGCKLKSGQVEWLKKNGIPFRVKANGHPAVLWSAVDGSSSKVVDMGWQPSALA